MTNKGSTGGESSDGFVVRRGQFLHWGDAFEFVAPVIKFVHDERGALQLVTSCAVPFGREVFIHHNGEFRLVGTTTDDAYCNPAYRKINAASGLQFEDPYLEEPYHSRRPRLASPLRTFVHEEGDAIGFLAAKDTPVEISFPTDGEKDMSKVIQASILRFYSPEAARNSAGILGKHLIDSSLRTAGIAIAINEDEGYAILAEPIDLATEAFSDADVPHVADYSVSGASFEDPETGLLLSSADDVLADLKDSDFDDMMQRAKSRIRAARDREAAA